MNVDTPKKFNHISLCTGYGGIDLGLARVLPNLRTLAYCEIELYAIENLIDKMEKGILPPCPIWSNLKTFPFKEFLGSVDILSGGFPCQPFSSAGQRAGDADPRHLFPFIKQGIVESRPAFVFLENVRGIISSKLQSDKWDDPKDTPVLLHVLREMERIGYDCHWGLFSARETGLPHLRQRVFILGKRRDIETSRLEEFSKYFQNSSQSLTGACYRDNLALCESTNEYDPRRYGAYDTTYVLQEITESAFSIERIESASICTPSGRDREQQFYEPPRTISKDMGNPPKGRCYFDNDARTNYRTPLERTGYGRSQSEEARSINASSNDERMEYRESIDGMEKTHQERCTRCKHDNADQGTCEHQSRGCENFKTSSLRRNEQTDQDLGNATETRFQRCHENAGDGREDDESGEWTRFDCITSTEIRHQQASDDLGNAYGKHSHTLKLPPTNEYTSESNGQQQTNRFRDASTYQNNDRETMANTNERGLYSLQTTSGICESSYRESTYGYVGNASIEIGQAHIYGTANDERTSTGEIGIRENTGRNQSLELSGNVESEMGRTADGASDWMDYEELCKSYTSIIDEIALLGNGVVPATAEIAFRTLFNKFL